MLQVEKDYEFPAVLLFNQRIYEISDWAIAQNKKQQQRERLILLFFSSIVQ